MLKCIKPLGLSLSGLPRSYILDYVEEVNCDKPSRLLHCGINTTIKMLYFRGHIYNTLFSSWFTNRHNKLKCYITIGWKDLWWTNALAYCAHSLVTKTMKCCKCGPRNLKMIDYA